MAHVDVPASQPTPPATLSGSPAEVRTAAPTPKPTSTPNPTPTTTPTASPASVAPTTPTPTTTPTATPFAASPPPVTARTTSTVPPWRFSAERGGITAPDIETLTGYRWPLAHPRLTLPFGPTPWGSRLVHGRQFHDGVDLATFCGDRIMAAHAGRVLAAGRHYDAYMGWIGDLGPYLRRLDRNHLWPKLPILVVVDDGNGYRSMYAHFERIVVKPGQRVRAGQLLGYEGATGRASGCHLHYGMFSPWEDATFAIVPDVAKRMKLPKTEIARVDPLKVLPPKRGINAPRTPKASPAP
jgi:murein DD-endopeptidase MepM/ murein hydrolase activator NlpD